VPVTPAVIAKAYNVGGVAVDRSRVTGNKRAVGSFLTQSMNSTDLETFFAELVPSSVEGGDTVTVRGNPGGEGAGQMEAR
jgi:hypothetical protein